MTSPITPIAGYRPQSADNLARVNENKQAEERLLRCLDAMAANGHDPRWLAIARTHIEQGFMAMNRAIMQPGRVKLPEDEAAKKDG